MSDLIRREDAIDALVNLTCLGIDEMKAQCEKAVTDSEEGWLGGILDAVTELESLPSAEPERKTGKWKPDESGNVYWICSVCGFASEAFGADILYHFCPNCGADMRGE